jgi:hypothetical protein
MRLWHLIQILGVSDSHLWMKLHVCSSSYPGHELMTQFDTPRSRQILDALRTRLYQDKRDAAEECELQAKGWFRVPYGHTEHAHISEWLYENCEGAYSGFRGRVLFEMESDAIAFRFTFT